MQVRSFGVAKLGFGKREALSQPQVKAKKHLPIVNPHFITSNQEEKAFSKGLEVSFPDSISHKSSPQGYIAFLNKGIVNADRGVFEAKPADTMRAASANLAREISGKTVGVFTSAQKKSVIQIPNLFKLGQEILNKAPKK